MGRVGFELAVLPGDVEAQPVGPGAVVGSPDLSVITSIRVAQW
ncbi:MAG: hypothetical protein ACRDR6_21930 [Pseudonocardiaceae bacterium]